MAQRVVEVAVSADQPRPTFAEQLEPYRRRPACSVMPAAAVAAAVAPVAPTKSYGDQTAVAVVVVAVVAAVVAAASADNSAR